MPTLKEAIKNLSVIPGIGKAMATDLYKLGIYQVIDLKNQDPEKLYSNLNKILGTKQDPCVLYVFRCAVYFANTPAQEQIPEKLLWWNWKNSL